MFNHHHNKETKMDICFSHRPNSGISIGVTVVGDKAYVASSFVRAKVDRFNRKMARRIIEQRLKSLIEDNKSVDYVAVHYIKPNTAPRDIIKQLRLKFKPDPFENDTTFVTCDKYQDVETRSQLPREGSWSVISNQFFEVCALCE